MRRETDPDGTNTYREQGYAAVVDTTTYTFAGNLDHGFNADLVQEWRFHGDVSSEGTRNDGSPPPTPPQEQVVITELPLDDIGPSSDVSRRQAILQEYLDRSIQLHRLQAELAETTDPAMIEVLQSEITTQQNILADLAEEAAGAGFDPADLAALGALAVTLAADDPIDVKAFVPNWIIDDAIGGVFTGTGQGLAATADGFIPFFDPFDGFYDPRDSTLQWSRFLGGVSRDLILAAAIPNLSQWVKNPFMYELGSTTIPGRLYTSLSHLTPIQRGEAIFRQLGYGGFCLSRFASPRVDWAATVFPKWSGLTPGGYLAGIGALHFADAIRAEIYDSIVWSFMCAREINDWILRDRNDS